MCPEGQTTASWRTPLSHEHYRLGPLPCGVSSVTGTALWVRHRSVSWYGEGRRVPMTVTEAAARVHKPARTHQTSW